MQSKIVVIAAYKVDLLKALINAVVAKIADIIIIGSKNKIVEICFLNNINYHLFDIYDKKHNIDICYLANEVIKKQKVHTIIFGDFPAEYQKNIITTEYEINVIDVSKFKHLIFTSTNTNVEYIGFEEKKDAIIVASEFMKTLQINYCAIGLVNCTTSKTSIIERNVIKMTPELNANLIEIIEPKDIFREQHNLLVFNSVEANKVFIETLVHNDDAKFARIKKASNKYVIDANNLRLKDIFFSIFILNKLRLNSEAS